VQIPGAPYDDILVEHLEAARSVLPADTPWIDAHTHTGQNDPDGVKGTAEELLAGLDRAGVQRSIVFTTAEPDGYPPANDRVRAEAAASGGRLTWFARIDPNAGDPLPEARRCLELGAQGFKLHPRSDAFVMSHPSVEALARLADAERRPILIHAGRGIPALGEDLVALARRYPGANFILAHAGISDLGIVAPAANELKNLYFDTSWWLVSDLLTLYETVDPSRILFASDMPYGSGRYAALAFLRCAREVGHGPEVLAAIAAGNAERVLAGEPPPDLGGPPGRGVLGERWLAGERVVAYSGIAMQLRFRGIDPSEAIALARLACQIPTGGLDGDEEPLLRVIDGLLAAAQELPAPPPPGQLSPTRAGEAAPVLAAHLLAGTPRVGLARG
jgi:predicted TIM-barrel fold metal-dependent hydrolase